MDMQSTLIGAPVSQIQGPEKVAGRTRFAADVDVPGMLWGKILRSPHPHARIRRMDASAAWSVSGVKAVVTGQDAPGHCMGKVLRDMPVLCWDRVRYIGPLMRPALPERLGTYIHIEREPWARPARRVDALWTAHKCIHGIAWCAWCKGNNKPLERIIRRHMV